MNFIMLWRESQQVHFQSEAKIKCKRVSVKFKTSYFWVVKNCLTVLHESQRTDNDYQFFFPLFLWQKWNWFILMTAVTWRLSVMSERLIDLVIDLIEMQLTQI